MEEPERDLKQALALKDSSNSRSALAIALILRGKVAEAEQIHLSGLNSNLITRAMEVACLLSRGTGFSHTLDFVPQSTVTSYYGIEGNYSIEGCMRVRWKGRINYWLAGVDAYLENGEWFFSTISTITGIDAPPRPCRKQNGK